VFYSLLIPLTFPEVKNMAKTKASQILQPWSRFILENIPVYPNFASLFYLVDKLKEHPLYSAMHIATPHGLALHMVVLVKRQRVMRIAMGEYARPTHPSQLARAWTRVSPGVRAKRIADAAQKRAEATAAKLQTRREIRAALQASRDALKYNVTNPLDN
jgi:hypothetical protein